MDNTTREDLAKLKEDLAIIKTAIKNNKIILNKIAYFVSMRYTIMFGGIAMILSGSAYHFAITHYGSFGAIPNAVQWALGIGIALIIAVQTIIKMLSAMRAAKEYDPSLHVSDVLKEMSVFTFFHSYYTTVLITIFIAVFAGVHGKSELIFPTIFIGSGLLFNLVASIFFMQEYSILGYWCILIGILSLLIASVPALIWLIIAGIGFLIIGIAIEIKFRLEQSRSL